MLLTCGDADSSRVPLEAGQRASAIRLAACSVAKPPATPRSRRLEPKSPRPSAVVAVWALVFLVGSTPPPGTHSSIRIWVSAAVLILMMAAACARAVVIPRLAHKNPRAWTPKRVGIYEVPLCVLAAAVALVA